MPAKMPQPGKLSPDAAQEGAVSAYAATDGISFPEASPDGISIPDAAADGTFPAAAASGRKATIRDVAREAGVAISTISRFLNRSGYVDEETGRRIAIRMLDYVPTRAAQILKSRKSRQVMLIVPDIGNPFYSEMAKVVQAAARDKGYAVILYNTNESASEELDAVRTAQSSQSDGLILCSINANDEIIQALLAAGITTVMANSSGKCPFDTVHGVKGAGTYIAARHLLDLGHRRIAFAGGPSGSETEIRRKHGWLQAMAESGLSCDKSMCCEKGFSEEAGYEAGIYFSTLTDLPTAICCANDLIALGVLDALAERGIGVPESISVTGMDNIPFSHLSHPPLTTVTNDSMVFGQNVSRLLFDRLEGYAGAPREMIVPRVLVPRASTSASTSECVER
jgi:LacI family transcriptional regulator